MTQDPRILVLGIGNVLWADEGFGVRAVEALNDGYEFPENVLVMDGGTQGVYLLPHLQDSDVVILLDAVDYHLDGGTIKIIEDGDVPTFMGAKKMSLHQTGFQEVLASAQLMGWEPKRLMLIGVQPVEIEDYGGSLRAPVAAQIPETIKLVLAELARWGVSPTPRQAAPSTSGPAALGPEALDRTLYEEGRPSEADAYRRGDIRFLGGALGAASDQDV
ncbi:MAG: HyaD/HybD family hydrogenase maturation endopeptidase [Pseudomonadota bacterium]